ncbi:hypothetical protein [Ralstonia pseudosolanacearum]|uniref:hypothetical protein n=1 Tax=Ralstonia pseudosolanacearum TaxID=1310165 RepID=UPI001FF71D9C|nr:hypothetical protein [Ralstonia pseudosolanacearum]
MERPTHDLKDFQEKYSDLSVHQPTSWWLALVSQLGRLTTSKLAIFAVVAISVLAAFKNLPALTTYVAIGAVMLVGLVCGFRER